VSEGEAARRTLGGVTIRTYGAVVVECAARDGQITVVVGDGTTFITIDGL